ncbi:MAG: PEP-CTERM sorting domain-containing protein [Phycisphaerae bacterium]
MTTGTSRWGDYSTIWADPTNPKDFWIFQELPDGTNPNQWDTWITEIDPPFIAAASAVPEPGALPLLFLGAAPLLLTLRRRKLGS